MRFDKRRPQTLELDLSSHRPLSSEFRHGDEGGENDDDDDEDDLESSRDRRKRRRKRRRRMRGRRRSDSDSDVEGMVDSYM